MGLEVKRLNNGLYQAKATPPHVREAWSTQHAISARKLVEELRNRGAHQRDIGDAMYEQDPKWIENLHSDPT